MLETFFFTDSFESGWKKVKTVTPKPQKDKEKIYKLKKDKW